MDPADILRTLDAMARDGLWPRFDDPLGTFEYHAMRLVAVRERDGDRGWGVAFECVLGDFLDEDNPYAAGVSTYLITPGDPFGTRRRRELPLTIERGDDRDPASLLIEGVVVHGPAGALRCTDAMKAELDLRPGLLCGGCDGGAEDSTFVVLLRAYLARYPGSLWSDVTELFDAPCDVIVAADAFEHVLGAGAAQGGPFAIDPSASPTYQSLARAIVEEDGAHFVPGPSNLDWRRWAVVPDGNARPDGRA